MKKRNRAKGYEKGRPDVYISNFIRKNFELVINVRPTKERGPDELYSLRASAFPPIDHVMQAALWLCWQMGDDEVKTVIRNVTILAHAGIVRKIAGRIVSRCFKGRVDLVPEFICEGNVGLIEAFERFDPFKGMFSTHANFWIKKRMYEHVSFISPHHWARGSKPRADAPPPDRTSEVERVYAVARKILNGMELRIFMARFTSPPVKLRLLGDEFGVTEGMIRKIARRALRKVAERMEHED